MSAAMHYMVLTSMSLSMNLHGCVSRRHQESESSSAARKRVLFGIEIQV